MYGSAARHRLVSEYAEMPSASKYPFRVVSLWIFVISRLNAIEWMTTSIPPNSLPTASTMPVML
jgi:hypothetical protein